LFAFKEGILDTPISALGGWPTVSLRLVRQIFAPVSYFTILRHELSGRTKRLVLPAWTTSEMCDLPTLGHYVDNNSTPTMLLIY
jgi:hypothetical protein